MSAGESDAAYQIFAAALELDASQRASYIATACAGDAQLQQRVLKLLTAADESARYFDEFRGRLGVERWMPDADALADAAVEPQLEGIAPGVRIGHFTLIERIGAGGMGTVWCAERSDGRYEGRVAIKFLAASERADALARFAREGRVLAKLDHPNIARLIDADIGPGGRPYLVLEYVQGLPIDRYCDERQLTIAQRLLLFTQVIGAISHAHKHLIIHRDIKPSNVAVTNDGVVKVLDFGISKLLSEEGALDAVELTQQVGNVLTPQFAAPEQIEGAEVTTATDVFALGMLLWRLLTEVTPRSATEVRSVAELRELAAREPMSLVDCLTKSTTPEVLATTAARRGTNSADYLRTLRSDLDGILRKATAVDPSERYGTASDFANDLHRYLNHEPVAARAPTVAYRLRKFVRRHSGGVLAATLTFLAIVSALVVALWQGAEARKQRDFAREQHARAQLSQEFTSFLLNDLASADEPVSLRDLLSRAEVMLQRQAEMTGDPNGPAMYELATAYFNSGQNDKLLELLGNTEAAAQSRGDVDLLAATQCVLGQRLLRTEPERGRAKLAQAFSAYRPIELPTAEALVACERAKALLAEADGAPESAVEILRAALRTVEAAHPGVRPRLFLLSELSRIHFDRSELAASLMVVDEILSNMRRAGLDRSKGYAVNLVNRSMLLQSSGEVRAAEATQREIFGDLRQLQLVAGVERPLADSSIRLARYEDALAALAAGESTVLTSGNPFELAAHRTLEGRASMFLGRFADARAKLDEAQSLLDRAPKRSERVSNALAFARGQLSLLSNDVPDARARTAALLNHLGYPDKTKSSLLPQLLSLAARIELGAGDAAAARRFADGALQLATQAARDPAQSADVGQALLARAKARRALGDDSGATADLNAALVSLQNGFGPEHPDVTEVQGLLARR